MAYGALTLVAPKAPGKSRIHRLIASSAADSNSHNLPAVAEVIVVEAAKRFHLQPSLVRCLFPLESSS